MQTFVEIIVVNDKSTEEEYYKYNWEENNIKIIHLEQIKENIWFCLCWRLPKKFWY